MMKNSKGITLISVIVSVIILALLTGIGVSSVYSGIQEYRKNAINTELGMVRQVIVEQYQKAKIVNKIEVPAQETQVNFWVGEKIEDIGDLGFEPAIVTQVYQEDYYYRLDLATLTELGLKDSKYTYIVNYKTGEVYNENAKMYFEPINYDLESKTVDETSFNDW